MYCLSKSEGIKKGINVAKKILIVDDEQDTLSVLEKSLAAKGYSVITARNGIDALSLAKAECPNLIIPDVALPDMLGGEVAVKLKEDLGTKNIPIIFLSALFSKKEEIEKDHVFGGHVMFAKPYEKQKLITAIRKLLREENRILVE